MEASDRHQTGSCQRNEQKRGVSPLGQLGEVSPSLFPPSSRDHQGPVLLEASCWRWQGLHQPDCLKDHTDPASTLDLMLWGDRLVSGLVTEIQGWPVTVAGVTLILEHPPFSEAFSLCTHGSHLSKRCAPALPRWTQGCTIPLQRWGKTHPRVLLPQVWSTDQQHQLKPLWEPPCQRPRIVSHWLRVGATGQPSQQGLWEALGSQSRGQGWSDQCLLQTTV